MIAAITIFCALVGFALFFFVVKRLIRMALRVALIGALLFGLLVGAIAWWWYDPLGGAPARPDGGRPQPSSSRPARR